MSFLSQISSLWSDERLNSADAARQLAEKLHTLTPDLAWVLDVREGGPSSLALSARMTVTLADRGDGVEARVVEPDQPGDDDPPMVLRAGYDVVNLAHSLAWRARIARGAVALHALRANAVYEVVQQFTDHNGQVLPIGTRLTFVSRQFLPYHGGHTLNFREATIFLQEDDEVCRAFERYFAFAKTQ